MEVPKEGVELCQWAARVAMECTLFPEGDGCASADSHRDSLFVPSFRALDCSNFVGISG